MAHGTSGAVTILRADGGEVTAINEYGQVLGMTIQGASDYLWTPSLPNRTSGEMHDLPEVSSDTSGDFHGLSAVDEPMLPAFPPLHCSASTDLRWRGCPTGRTRPVGGLWQLGQLTQMTMTW
jgi:hypothetical protein